MMQVKNPSLGQDKHIFYITGNIYVCHHDEKCMYDNMRWKYHTCPAWRRTCIRLLKIGAKTPKISQLINLSALQLLSASGWLESVKMNIIGQISETLISSQSLLSIMDLYSKLNRCLPTFRTTASHIAYLFTYDWNTPYGIPTHVLLDNWMAFVSEFFESIFVFLFTKYFTTMSYH